jgi:hypothetical protein
LLDGGSACLPGTNMLLLELYKRFYEVGSKPQ